MDEQTTGGRKLALTIIIGVFVSIMVITLVNLIVSYTYEAPQYDRYCNGTQYDYSKPYFPSTGECAFNRSIDEAVNSCTSQRGSVIYEYNDSGCPIAVKNCDLCSKNLEDATKKYNRESFFIFAIIGFILIVVGLFIHVLLLQIITLPAGAILVIESAVRNFDDKLAVIITFALLIVAATYLALKKLR